VTVRYFSPEEFTGERAWEAVDVAEIDGATVRLYWTDAPYVWHVNDGSEVFVVVDGAVDMHHRRRDGRVHVQRLEVGDVCHAEPGDEHVAHPAPVARILVVERKGSI
jgi:mannose-6-phosphate isomerase-like protein (cupin superfamily)